MTEYTQEKLIEEGYKIENALIKNVSLKGKYVRVATKGWVNPIKIIGNLIEDRWFDYESFYRDKEDK